MNNWLNKIQSVLYPYTCFLCNQPGHNELDLCSSCYQELQRIQTCCKQCGIKMNTAESHICGKCLKTSPYFDKITTLFEYQGAAKQLILSLKYNKKYNCGRTIGKLMSDHFIRSKSSPDALIAVPLHKKRLFQRKYNQSVLIAQHIHQQLGIDLLHNHCTRISNTASQTTLKAEQRRKNLKNAFHSKPLSQYKSIAVIDDVVTTGSTANEIAKTLKKAGAKHVEIWAFARA